MVIAWIGHTSSKTRVICPKVKKISFWNFFVILPRKFSSGHRSDNIDASGLPNSSSESLCPKVFREHVKNAETLKIGGPSPLQSHLIRFRVRQRSCFSGSFLQKITSHGQTVHFWLYSVVHYWKALLESFHMVFLKKKLRSWPGVSFDATCVGLDAAKASDYDPSPTNIVIVTELERKGMAVWYENPDQVNPRSNGQMTLADP